MSIKLFKASKQSLISAILIDNNVLDEVADIIESEDFYATAHQKIYAGILELTAQGKPADLVTLVNLLRNKNQLDSIGGAAYLSKIVDFVPLAVNAGHYAGIIRGFISRDNWMELNHAAGNLASAPIFIDDSTDLTA
jgi:replicative DNA helicase